MCLDLKRLEKALLFRLTFIEKQVTLGSAGAKSQKKTTANLSQDKPGLTIPSRFTCGRAKALNLSPPEAYFPIYIGNWLLILENAEAAVAPIVNRKS